MFNWQNPFMLTLDIQDIYDSAGDEEITGGVFKIDMHADDAEDLLEDLALNDEFEIISGTSDLEELVEYIISYCDSAYDIIDIVKQVAAIDTDDVQLVNDIITTFSVQEALDGVIDDVLSHDMDEVNSAIDVFGARSGLEYIVNDDYEYLDGVTDDAALGEYLVREDGFPSLEQTIPYLDLESIGEDLMTDLDSDEVERIEQEEGVENYALRFVEDGGLGNDYDPYFDYDSYGHDCYGDYIGGYSETGFIYVK